MFKNTIRRKFITKNFGSHHSDYENKWNNAINKQFGKRIIISDRMMYDYTDDLCAPFVLVVLNK